MAAATIFRIRFHRTVVLGFDKMAGKSGLFKRRPRNGHIGADGEKPLVEIRGRNQYFIFWITSPDLREKFCGRIHRLDRRLAKTTIDRYVSDLIRKMGGEVNGELVA